MAFCTTCGAQIADGSVCAACAGRAASSAPATASAGGLEENIAAALAYFTIIPAVIFLVLEPFNRNRFIRFHSWQCILFHVAWAVLWFGLHLVAAIPFLGWMTLLFWPIIGLAGFILWIILVLKAYQRQMFKLPVIGDFAEKQANAM